MRMIQKNRTYSLLGVISLILVISSIVIIMNPAKQSIFGNTPIGIVTPVTNTYIYGESIIVEFVLPDTAIFIGTEEAAQVVGWTVSVANVVSTDFEEAWIETRTGTTLGTNYESFILPSLGSYVARLVVDILRSSIFSPDPELTGQHSEETYAAIFHYAPEPPVTTTTVPITTTTTEQTTTVDTTTQSGTDVAPKKSASFGFAFLLAIPFMIIKKKRTDRRE